MLKLTIFFNYINTCIKIIIIFAIKIKYMNTCYTSCDNIYYNIIYKETNLIIHYPNNTNCTINY